MGTKQTHPTGACSEDAGADHCLGNGYPAGFLRLPGPVEIYEAPALNARLTVVFLGGHPWFVAADVRRALDLCETVLRRLDPDERTTLPIPQPGGGVLMPALVSESGLLALCGLFTLCGRHKSKPSEPAFRKWVVYSLLPAVHRRAVDVESVSVSVAVPALALNGKGGL